MITVVNGTSVVTVVTGVVYVVSSGAFRCRQARCPTLVGPTVTGGTVRVAGTVRTDGRNRVVGRSRVGRSGRTVAAGAVVLLGLVKTRRGSSGGTATAGTRRCFDYIGLLTVRAVVALVDDDGLTMVAVLATLVLLAGRVAAGRGRTGTACLMSIAELNGTAEVGRIDAGRGCNDLAVLALIGTAGGTGGARWDTGVAWLPLGVREDVTPFGSGVLWSGMALLEALVLVFALTDGSC